MCWNGHKGYVGMEYVGSCIGEFREGVNGNTLLAAYVVILYCNLTSALLAV